MHPPELVALLGKEELVHARKLEQIALGRHLLREVELEEDVIHHADRAGRGGA